MVVSHSIFVLTSKPGSSVRALCALHHPGISLILKYAFLNAKNNHTRYFMLRMIGKHLWTEMIKFVLLIILEHNQH